MNVMRTIKLKVLENSGASLLELTVAGSLMSAVILGTSNMAIQSVKMDKLISSGANLNQATNQLSLIVNRKESCAKSGLLGVIVDPSSPDLTELSLHLPGATGPASLFMKEGTELSSGQTVKTVRFESMVPTGTVNGNNSYFATLEFITTLDKGLNTERDQTPRKIYLNLVLTPSNQIVECYGGNPTFSPTITVVGDPPPPDQSKSCDGYKKSTGFNPSSSELKCEIYDPCEGFQARRFVNRVYQRLLDRAPTETEQALASVIINSYAAGDIQGLIEAAREITDGAELRRKLIREWYPRLTGQYVSAPEENRLLTFFGAPNDYATVLGQEIAGSGVAFAYHGSMCEGNVNAWYQKILHREPDLVARDAWVDMCRDVSPKVAAFEFVKSLESYNIVVGGTQDTTTVSYHSGQLVLGWWQRLNLRNYDPILMGRFANHLAGNLVPHRSYGDSLLNLLALDDFRYQCP